MLAKHPDPTVDHVLKTWAPRMIVQGIDYNDLMAAAIEAVASTGGQIMPPVMGAAAFLIAEFLNITYGQVALAAAIPACLYYLALFVQVDLEAAKNGSAGLPADQIPKFRDVMRRGWIFTIPLVILIYALMIEDWDAAKSGMAAVIAVFVVGALQKDTRPTFQGILNSIHETGRTMLDIIAIVALAGLVIGALQLSAIAFKLSMMLVTISGGHALLLLILTALGCLFLGLPLPTTVVYIMLGRLCLRPPDGAGFSESGGRNDCAGCGCDLVAGL